MAGNKWELVAAARELSDRGLVQSAKWVSELAVSLPFSPPPDGYQRQLCDIDREWIEEMDKYTFAKTCFDCREYSRAAFHLASCHSKKSVFLRGYALYLAGEKNRHDHTSSEITAKPQKKEKSTKHLQSLKIELSQLYEDKKLDGYSLYLYGIVLKELDQRDKLRGLFEECVNKTPFLWSAWQELAATCKDRESLETLNLPSYWMTELFMAYACLHLQYTEESLQRYNNLTAAWLPEDSPHVKSQKAMVYYNARDFEEAGRLYGEVFERDPERIDEADFYSNVLFVMDKKAELSYLAHHLVEVDRYRPETCCVIGNYYGLRGEHHKSVQYFQRACLLDPSYLSAWTLLGHEYVELKNIPAAIQAYRKAVDADPSDYRAWYGLGQTYEMLRMPLYAVHYYQKAHQLRPNDSRMLVALGEIYERLDKHQLAKKCYWRAVLVGDIEHLALLQLAKLYEQLGENEDAARVYTRLAQQINDHGTVASSGDLSRCFRFLVLHHLRSTQDLDQAEKYAHKCCEYAETLQEGTSFLEEIGQLRRMEQTLTDDDVNLMPLDQSLSPDVNTVRFS
ncbi:cell division cycle protein 23 homolog [Corticium candelabrum]|uniref:cell division cycle protein 23 homolog n=1 Tax=Corticium candelabrum TaxID=121492 RepID=UPI002E2703FE|nr:cell division cycle protein 23 homolog [Corticium candelabrum]